MTGTGSQQRVGVVGSWGQTVSNEWVMVIYHNVRKSVRAETCANIQILLRNYSITYFYTEHIPVRSLAQLYTFRLQDNRLYAFGNCNYLQSAANPRHRMIPDSCFIPTIRMIVTLLQLGLSFLRCSTVPVIQLAEHAATV